MMNIIQIDLTAADVHILHFDGMRWILIEDWLFQWVKEIRPEGKGCEGQKNFMASCSFLISEMWSWVPCSDYTNMKL